MRNLILKPAHGRDYDNPDQVLNSWDLGHDFEVENKQYPHFYTNKREFYRQNSNGGAFSGTEYIHFKYSNLTKRKVIKPSVHENEFNPVKIG